MNSKAFAVLGDPISHSLSPKIHTAAYEFLQLDYSYQAIQVHAGELRAFIDSEGHRFGGFSITMPLKFEAAKIATSAELLGTGVCNTLLRNDSLYIGFNTDIYGIRRAVETATAEQFRSITILGSGATARSALIAAQQLPDVTAISVFARDVSKAVSLKGLVVKENIEFGAFDLEDFAGKSDLTINTLPSGVANTLSFDEGQKGWLLSAGYATLDALFSEHFSKDRFIGGTEMLLWQAVEQVKIFSAGDLAAEDFDAQTLVEVMRSAL